MQNKFVLDVFEIWGLKGGKLWNVVLIFDKYCSLWGGAHLRGKMVHVNWGGVMYCIMVQNTATTFPPDLWARYVWQWWLFQPRIFHFDSSLLTIIFGPDISSQKEYLRVARIFLMALFIYLSRKELEKKFYARLRFQLLIFCWCRGQCASLWSSVLTTLYI